MKYVDRTATEYDDQDGSSVQASRPLSAYRSERAYVLLGDPGAGKTTAFKREAEASEAQYATARELVRGDIDGVLDAKDAVLFIDGLDEVRASGGDPRSPLDEIVAQLRKLASPRFRISCRPADWGLTDTNALWSLLDGDRLPVLRLDPLGSDDIRDVLDELPAAQGMDTADFVRQAVEQGLGGLLDNPQSLELLTSVVANGEWPASRTEVFEKACQRLVQERNPEHIDAGRRRGASELGAERLLDAAGRLSAFFLLTDAHAICRSGPEKRNHDLALEEAQDGDGEALSRALATKLFVTQSPGRFVPVHLHVAEYLGARFLRDVIKGRSSVAGLPSVRVLALLTGHDGGVSPGLRGLAAWLAALCKEVRHALTSADPIGVLAYGDAGWFGDDNLADLIRALDGKNRQLLRQAWSAPALGSMIRPRTIDLLRAYIADDDRSDPRQAVVDLFLRGIPHAAPTSWTRHARSRSISRSFVRALLCVVRDSAWWPRVRHAGLAAALHAAKSSGEGCELVDELLSEVKEGRVLDPDNELRGKLLTALYPNRIPPEQIWDYVPKTANRMLFGHDVLFWSKRIEQNTPSADLPVLLDGLLGSTSRLLAVLREGQLDDLVHHLLARALEEHGEAVPVSRLSKWIELAARSGPPDTRRRTPELERMRSWLAAHPTISRACLLEFLTRNVRQESLELAEWRYCRALFNGSPPPGFADWCLDHAVVLADSHAPAAQLLLERAVSLRRAESDFDRWVASADARLQDRPELRDHLASLVVPPAPLIDQAEWNKKASAFRRRRRREEEEFVAHVREHASSLAAGSCKPVLLDCLARTYFGFDSGHRSSNPVDALRSSLGSDESLVSATLSGFERLRERDDLPDLHEIVRLDNEGKRSLFALPLLAGLAEGDRAGCGGHRGLTADGIRRAVGFYYLTPRPMVQGQRLGWYRRADAPGWYDELLRSHVEPVSESLVAVHLSKIRRREHCEEHLAALARDPKYRKLVRLAGPSLLRAFPVRCTRPQVLALRHLLWASVRYMPDGLASCVATKLARSGMDVAQRALWLGTGMLMSPSRYLATAMEFVGNGSTVRARHLMDFLVPDDLPSFSAEQMEWSAEQLAMAVQGVGATVEPWRPPDGNELKARIMTPTNQAANKAERLLSAWLGELAERPGAKAADALKSLAAAPELAAWRHQILEAHDQQTVLRRAHLYRPPTADELRKVLQDGQPANAADLLALLVDRLEHLAREIRDGNTDDWRQYWHVDSHGRPEKPRPEPTCRDALLSDLRHCLRDFGVNVDAQPEAHCAEGKRSDIRVYCDGHAVPVEIKENTHPRLWSAINDQLIDQYARAPESGGHGVYLVLWFGPQYTRASPSSGRYPKTPEALRERLQNALPPDQRHKIKVVVVDVSRPEAQGR